MNKLQEAIAKLEADMDRSELNERLLQMLLEKQEELGSDISDEEAEEAAGAEHHDALDAALRDADLHIPHITQTAAVADIDDLLAPHQCKAIDHSIPPHEKLMWGGFCPIHRSLRRIAPPLNIPGGSGQYSSHQRLGGFFMHGKVEISGINTAHLQVLKNDEMTRLLRQAAQGDTLARETLICGNLRLVLSVIQKFLGRGENMDDLFQVGCIGLMKAIDNFDVEQGVRFSTYGVPMIVGEIRRYLRDNSALRVSRSMRDTAYRVLQAREKLMRESQREPTVEQIAKELDIPREEVVFAMDAVVDPVSLYEPVYSDSGDTLCVMDQVGDRLNTDESWIEQIALKDAMDRLSQREKRILAMRFYQGKTQMEVSQEIGISQAQVSRLEKSAISSIKKGL